MIPYKVLQNLRNNPLLENEFMYSLGIDECKDIYQVFEKVLISVAKTKNKHWRVLYNATKKDVENYTLLCVSMILIDKFLRIEFRLAINKREILLRDKYNQIVRDYYRYI
jgi:hypothetical protein